MVRSQLRNRAANSFHKHHCLIFINIFFILSPVIFALRTIVLRFGFAVCPRARFLLALGIDLDRSAGGAACVWFTGVFPRIPHQLVLVCNHRSHCRGYSPTSVIGLSEWKLRKSKFSQLTFSSSGEQQRYYHVLT